MKLSVIIPARNEAGSITETLTELFGVLSTEGIDHEILVVNDGSTDATGKILEGLRSQIKTLVPLTNTGLHGFGRAVTYGLDRFTGDCAAIMMADRSDDPRDLVKFYRTMVEKNCDAVFGSRFIRGGSVRGYPSNKLILNRILNTCIRILFLIRYNDTTNAFKLYRRETILGLRPFLSPSFSLTVELPLKTIIRGYSYQIVSNSWTGRKFGASKMKFKEAGSRYLFIIIYCLAERLLSGRDYKKVTV